MSPEEQKVIDILVNHPHTSDRYLKPIYAVDKAMGWDTNKTRVFVDGLAKHNMIVAKSELTNGPRTGGNEGLHSKKNLRPQRFWGFNVIASG